jgi:hypothetical protein
MAEHPLPLSVSCTRCGRVSCSCNGTLPGALLMADGDRAADRGQHECKDEKMPQRMRKFEMYRPAC